MEVDCAYDGEEAIRMAKETEYDLSLIHICIMTAEFWVNLELTRQGK